MNKLKLIRGLIRTYPISQLISYYFFNKGKYHLFNLKNNLSYLIRINSRDFNTINENEIEHNYQSYLNKIKPAKVIIDVGANIGCFSIECAKLFKDCQIYAYEPFKESYKICQINLKINDLDRVKVCCAAITKSSGFAELGIYDGQFEANSIGKIWGRPSRSTQVKTFNLNTIFSDNKIKYCDLLKLDCEGSEYEILENLDNKIFAKIGSIIMEYHLGREDILRHILEKNNFRVNIRKFTDKSGLLFAYKLNAIK